MVLSAAISELDNNESVSVKLDSKANEEVTILSTERVFEVVEATIAILSNEDSADEVAANVEIGILVVMDKEDRIVVDSKAMEETIVVSEKRISELVAKVLLADKYSVEVSAVEGDTTGMNW